MQIRLVRGLGWIGRNISAPALNASKTGSDILHTPNFHRDRRKAERAGRCLNLTHPAG